MALTINITEGCGLSNEANHELIEEEQCDAVYAIHLPFNLLYFTNKTEYLRFKSGRVMWDTKFDWP